MSRYKKWRHISIFLTTGIAIVVPIFSIGCSKSVAAIIAKNEEPKSMSNFNDEEIVKAMQQDITIDKNLIGMEYNPEKYDELVEARIKYTKTEDINYYIFESEELKIKFMKPSMSRAHISYELMEETVKAILKNTDVSITTQFYKLWYGEPLTITFIENMSDDYTMGRAPSDKNGTSIQLHTLNNEKVLVPPKFLISRTIQTLQHEFGHFMQAQAINSRNSINFFYWEYRPLNSKTRSWAGFKERFDYNSFNIFSSSNSIDEWNNLINSSEPFVEQQLYSSELAKSIIKNYFPIVNQNKQLVTIYKRILSILVDAMRSDHGYSMGTFFRNELITRSQTEFKNLYNVDDIKSETFIPFENLHEQFRVQSIIGLDHYPSNLQFSKTWMSAWYRSYFGIGDMNTLFIDDARKKIWFGASSTNLSDIIGSIKIVYDNETINLDIKNKQYPFGWHYQPLSFKYDYKYVSNEAYAFNTYQLSHGDTKPKQIIFYDKQGKEIQPINTQLTIAGNYRSRYIFDKPTKSWKDNYNLEIK